MRHVCTCITLFNTLVPRCVYDSCDAYFHRQITMYFGFADRAVHCWYRCRTICMYTMRGHVGCIEHERVVCGELCNLRDVPEERGWVNRVWVLPGAAGKCDVYFAFANSPAHG